MCCVIYCSSRLGKYGNKFHDFQLLYNSLVKLVGILIARMKATAPDKSLTIFASCHEKRFLSPLYILGFNVLPLSSPLPHPQRQRPARFPFTVPPQTLLCCTTSRKRWIALTLLYSRHLQALWNTAFQNDPTQLCKSVLQASPLFVLSATMIRKRCWHTGIVTNLLTFNICSLPEGKVLLGKLLHFAMGATSHR